MTDIRISSLQAAINVVENRILSRIYRFKRAKVTGVCRKLRKKSIIFCTLKCCRVSNSRRIRGTEKKGCIGDVRNAEIGKEKEKLRDLNSDGRIILK